MPKEEAISINMRCFFRHIRCMSGSGRFNFFRPYHRYRADRNLRKVGESAMPMILEMYRLYEWPSNYEWLRGNRELIAASCALSHILAGDIGRPPGWDDATVAEACLKNRDWELFGRHSNFFLPYLAGFNVDWEYIQSMPFHRYKEKGPRGQFICLIMDEWFRRNGETAFTFLLRQTEGGYERQYALNALESMRTGIVPKPPAWKDSDVWYAYGKANAWGRSVDALLNLSHVLAGILTQKFLSAECFCKSLDWTLACCAESRTTDGKLAWLQTIYNDVNAARIAIDPADETELARLNRNFLEYVLKHIDTVRRNEESAQADESRRREEQAEWERDRHFKEVRKWMDQQVFEFDCRNVAQAERESFCSKYGHNYEYYPANYKEEAQNPSGPGGGVCKMCHVRS